MSTKEEARGLASEIITDLTVTMLMTRDGLIQSRNQIDREIKRIENCIGKDTVKKITEGR